MGNLKDDLAEMMDQADWNALIPHAKRDALIVVTPGLDLLDVGVAIATDRIDIVQGWIGQGLIAKPSQAQLELWNQFPGKQFTALIVQPYVLIQEQATQPAEAQ